MSTQPLLFLALPPSCGHCDIFISPCSVTSLRGHVGLTIASYKCTTLWPPVKHCSLYHVLQVWLVENHVFLLKNYCSSFAQVCWGVAATGPFLFCPHQPLSHSAASLADPSRERAGRGPRKGRAWLSSPAQRACAWCLPDERGGMMLTPKFMGFVTLTSTTRNLQAGTSIMASAVIPPDPPFPVKAPQ